MKILAILLALSLLTGCTAGEPASENLPVLDSQSSQSVPLTFCAIGRLHLLPALKPLRQSLCLTTVFP